MPQELQQQVNGLIAARRHTPRIQVLMVTRFLDRGGMEQVILAYARLLQRERFALTVATMGGGNVASEIGRLGDVRLAQISGATRSARFRALLSLARELKPSIVHNHFSWYGLFVGLLVGARRVETMHNMYGWWKGYERAKYALYLLLSSKIIAVSDSILRFNQRHFRIISPAKCTVVHNGVDTEAIEKAVPNSNVRHDLGIPLSEVVFVFVGRFDVQKGIHHLLAAAAAVRREGKQFRLILAGEGSLGEHLRGAAHDAGLDNVHFIGFRSDVASLLKACDVFVLPSLYEGLPLSLLEAMAAGLPAIATSVGGVPEAVVDGMTGFLVPPGDAHAIASRMTQLIADPALRVTMGRNAMLRAREEFSVKRMVRATEEIYEQLLDAPETGIRPRAGHES